MSRRRRRRFVNRTGQTLRVPELAILGARPACIAHFAGRCTIAVVVRACATSPNHCFVAVCLQSVSTIAVGLSRDLCDSIPHGTKKSRVKSGHDHLRKSLPMLEKLGLFPFSPLDTEKKWECSQAPSLFRADDVAEPAVRAAWLVVDQTQRRRIEVRDDSTDALQIPGFHARRNVRPRRRFPVGPTKMAAYSSIVMTGRSARS